MLVAGLKSFAGYEDFDSVTDPRDYWKSMVLDLTNGSPVLGESNAGQESSISGSVPLAAIRVISVYSCPFVVERHGHTSGLTTGRPHSFLTSSISRSRVKGSEKCPSSG